MDLQAKVDRLTHRAHDVPVLSKECNGNHYYRAAVIDGRRVWSCVRTGCRVQNAGRKVS